MAARTYSLRFKLKTVWRTERDMSGPQARFMIELKEEDGQLVQYDWITFSDHSHAKFLADPQRDERVLECAYHPQHETLMYDPDEEAEPTWDYPRVRAGGWKCIRVCKHGAAPGTLREAKEIEVAVINGVSAMNARKRELEEAAEDDFGV